MSLAKTVTFFQESIKSLEFLVTSVEVWTAGIISTNGINGAGLKKWIPITRSEFWQAAAIDAIDNDDVFDANIQSGLTIVSNCLNTDFLMSKFSIMASITNPQLSKSVIDVE